MTVTEAESDLLTPEQVAQRLHVGVKTLRQWRWLGRGPDFVKMSYRQVLYSPAAVQAWIDSQTVTPSPKG